MSYPTVHEPGQMCIRDRCAFLGAPIIALAVGTLFGVALLAGAKRLNKFYELTNETLKTVGPILFVTAAGGVLGKVIAVSGMVETITANASIPVSYTHLLA